MPSDAGGHAEREAAAGTAGRGEGCGPGRQMATPGALHGCSPLPRRLVPTLRQWACQGQLLGSQCQLKRDSFRFPDHHKGGRCLSGARGEEELIDLLLSSNLCPRRCSSILHPSPPLYLCLPAIPSFASHQMSGKLLAALALRFSESNR